MRLKRLTIDTDIFKSRIYLHLFFFLFFFTFSTYSNAQFQIVGMLFNGQQAQSVELTILQPNTKPFNGTVNYDPNVKYNSGTVFKTPANTSIAISYKDQKQVLSPNSSLEVAILKKGNGIKAQTLTGKVKHILTDVKNKVGFYKAGNGYTWAHAEGTIFTVEAFDRSKKVKFNTEEGKVAIIEEVPISVRAATKNQKTKSGKNVKRKLSTTKRTYQTVGEEYVSVENQNAIEYDDYEAALEQFRVDINEKEASFSYPEELANDYSTLGELYLDNDQVEEAIDPLRKALHYSIEADLEDTEIMEAYLNLSEALLESDNDENNSEGNSLVQKAISGLNEVLNEYESEYNFLIENDETDLAWDVCSELVDITEYLGWSYELINEDNDANIYFNKSEQYQNRL